MIWNLTVIRLDADGVRQSATEYVIHAADQLQAIGNLCAFTTGLGEFHRADLVFVYAQIAEAQEEEQTLQVNVDVSRPREFQSEQDEKLFETLLELALEARHPDRKRPGNPGFNGAEESELAAAIERDPAFLDSYRAAYADRHARGKDGFERPQPPEAKPARKGGAPEPR